MYSTCASIRSYEWEKTSRLDARRIYTYVPAEAAGVMHGVPFRRALTPVYKGEITPPAIPVFSELD